MLYAIFIYCCWNVCVRHRFSETASAFLEQQAADIGLSCQRWMGIVAIRLFEVIILETIMIELFPNSLKNSFMVVFGGLIFRCTWKTSYYNDTGRRRHDPSFAMLELSCGCCSSRLSM